MPILSDAADKCFVVVLLVVVGGVGFTGVVEGFVEAARRSLAEVQGLFGVPAPTSTSAGVSGTTGGGGAPGWSGTSSGREQSSAVALDNRRTDFTGADRQLDAWGRRTAADTANGRSSAGALVTSADSTTRALAPYTNSVPGRVALVSSLTDHLSRSGGVVSGYAATLPGRQADLAAIASQYGAPAPGTPPPAPPPRRPPPRRRRRKRRPGGRGGRSPANFRMGSGFGGGGGMPGRMSMPTSGLSGLMGAKLPGLGGGGPGSPFPPAVIDKLSRSDGSLRGLVVNAASEKLGSIYKWGGKGGPNDGGRVDCSGLTSYAYRRIGIDIGPDTFTQITKGVQIAPSQIKPGDLIFCNFGTQGGNPGPGHVVMATGYGAGSRIIEASQSGQPVAFGGMPQGRIVVKRILP